MVELVVILLLIFLLWFWWDSLGAREVARNAGRNICQKHGVQFLDDTVAVSRIRLQRGSSGKLYFSREFGFEFSDSGEERSMGRVTVTGRRVLKVEIDLKEF